MLENNLKKFLRPKKLRKSFKKIFNFKKLKINSKKKIGDGKIYKSSRQYPQLDKNFKNFIKIPENLF